MASFSVLSLFYFVALSPTFGQFEAFGSLISITADDGFELYGSLDDPIGTGNEWRQVFNFSLPSSTDQIFIEAKDTGGAQGIILATSAGLVSNSSWRCIAKQDTSIRPPYVNASIDSWPAAEEVVGPSDGYSGPEFQKGAKWIWAPKSS